MITELLLFLVIYIHKILLIKYKNLTTYLRKSIEHVKQVKEIILSYRNMRASLSFSIKRETI